MAFEPWDTPCRPEGVPREITGFEKSIFSLLNQSAKTYPNNTFTIFNGRFKSYARVRDTVNRIAHFMADVMDLDEWSRLPKEPGGKGEKLIQWKIFSLNIPKWPWRR